MSAPGRAGPAAWALGTRGGVGEGRREPGPPASYSSEVVWGVCVCVVGVKGAGHGRRGFPEYTGKAGRGCRPAGGLKDGDLGAGAGGAAVEGFLNVKAEVRDGAAGWRTSQTVARSPVSRAFSEQGGREGRAGGPGA